MGGRPAPGLGTWAERADEKREVPADDDLILESVTAQQRRSHASEEQSAGFPGGDPCAPPPFALVLATFGDLKGAGSGGGTGIRQGRQPVGAQGYRKTF